MTRITNPVAPPRNPSCGAPSVGPLDLSSLDDHDRRACVVKKVLDERLRPPRYKVVDVSAARIEGHNDRDFRYSHPKMPRTVEIEGRRYEAGPQDATKVEFEVTAQRGEGPRVGMYVALLIHNETGTVLGSRIRDHAEAAREPRETLVY